MAAPKQNLGFHKAVNDHNQAFGSNKIALLKANADVIDCAQYGGCNNY